MDAFTRRGHRDALLQITIVVQVLHMVPAMLIFAAPSLSTMWMAYGASMLITGTFQVAASSVLTESTPSHLIGKAVALFSMTQNFLGLAIGPTIFALVSEGMFEGPRAIVHAMIICYALFITIATALVAWLMVERRGLREGLAR
jgi:MFS family permease